MEYYPLPDEHVMPPEEYTLPCEQARLSKCEFTQELAEPVSEKKSRHNLLKRMMLMPVAATLSAITIVFAAYGNDPLGIDFLNSSSSPKAPVSSVVPSIPPSDNGDSDSVVVIHVTYVPTGETYTPSSTGDEAMSDAVEWVISKGGDGSTMKYVRSEKVFAGYETTEGTIIVGDPDNLEDAYIASGSLIRTYRRDVYYDAYERTDSDVSDDKADDAFPKLSNTSADFDGKYAWNGMGLSEQYIRYTSSESAQTGMTGFKYIVAGQVWTQYYGAVESTEAGAEYDASTNTLTLKNFSASLLDINLMGNGFTIKLVGKNSLDQLKVWGAGYGGSLKLTGSGSLTVNKSGKASGGVGIHLDGEWSQTCLMIDKSVTLDVYGDYAMVVSATTMEKAIYYLNPLKMTGGRRTSGQFTEYATQQYAADGTLIGEVPTTLAEISEQRGIQYYDYAVVGEDGMPSKHVTFKP